MEKLSNGITRVSAAALAGICLLAATGQANIAIKPAFVEVNMDEGRPAGTFLISNVGETEERFRVNAIHFTYTEAGALQQSPTGNYSLAPWIYFNPRELTLAPKTQRAVRFTVVPKGRLTPGEWWAAMELESLVVNDIVKRDEQTGRSAKLKAITKLLVPIFGTVGKVSYEGQVKDVQVQVEKGAVVLKAMVAATGTGRLRIESTYEIADASGNVVDSGPFAIGYVFRGGQRWFTRKIEAVVPKGEYTVKLNIKSPHVEPPVIGEAKVTWPDVLPASAATDVKPAAQPAAPEKQPSQPNGPMDGSKLKEVQGSAGSP
jgi:hypothetical protein